MKTKIIIVLCAFFSGVIVAAGQQPTPIMLGNRAPMDHLDENDSRAFYRLAKHNLDSLVHSGCYRLSTSQTPVLLAWPLSKASNLGDPDYYQTGNFIDHDTASPGSLQDYNCGTRTYDVTGYNHQGTDIGLWPFPWYKMDSNQVEVRAAAGGLIVTRSDGNFDRNCTMNSSMANMVCIRQQDGNLVYYVHMKSGSVTNKNVGDYVIEGEYLGRVGSSGSSTAPHLHFEVQDSLGRVIDPWSGPCNPVPSLWQLQRPYYDSKLNSMLTARVTPVLFPACPLQEEPNGNYYFFPGELIYLEGFYADQQTGQNVIHDVRMPDGTSWMQWLQTFTATVGGASAWYYAYYLPQNAMTGVWTYSITYNGITNTKNFEVVLPTSLSNAEAAGHRLSLFPNPAKESVVVEFRIPVHFSSASLKIVDRLGMLCSEEEVHVESDSRIEYRIPHELPSGCYHIIIQGLEDRWDGKLVVID